MFTKPETKCAKCGRGLDQVRLKTCAVCRHYFCAACTSRRFGKEFCSVGCADLFFSAGEGSDDE